MPLFFCLLHISGSRGLTFLKITSAMAELLYAYNLMKTISSKVERLGLHVRHFDEGAVEFSVVDVWNIEKARVKTFAEHDGEWYYTITLPTLGKEMTFEYLDLSNCYGDCCDLDGEYKHGLYEFRGIDEFLVRELEM